MKIDISIIARDMKLAPENVEAAIELLDAGNTIPFVTRFRRDLTGDLNEEQLLEVKTKVAQLRALADRKVTILRAIEVQGELNDSLKNQILKTTSSRRLEDIYLPYKTKKQSRASLARQQGLGPLADEILSTNEVDFAVRATDFVRVDKGLNTVDDVIKGVGDLVAEKFAENDKLRIALRKLIRDSGQITSQLTAPETTQDSPKATTPAPAQVKPTTETPTTETPTTETPTTETPTTETPTTETPTAVTNQVESSEGSSQVNSALSETPTQETPTQEIQDEAAATADAVVPQVAATPGEPSADTDVSSATSTEGSTTSDVPTPSAPVEPESNSSDSPTDTGDKQVVAQSSLPAATDGDSAEKPAAKTKSKKKKKKKQEDPFKDFQDFSQAVGKIPHYRLLALNRGERAGKLRVKIKVDQEKANELAFEHLVPADHPSATFLKKCATDTLNRSLMPSVEREVRRELTEAAERHAVEVFANNLKNLLLQPPIRNRVILAIDPGYKRGCSVAIIDGCGNLIDSGQVFVVGNQSRRDESKSSIRDWVKQYQVEIIAIGNGTGCRQVEQLVSDTIAEHLVDDNVRYIIINEAGTSIYSTSETGRDELPDVSPAVRSAVSIGRRLLDPLSELVKISPANIGVGMYQHDIKAKHLSDSLDAVVQFCVNRVGVDVNTASSSLLKYVSGLNALTARRVIEYRREHGRFNCREELRNVSGVGDTTYVQAAGFLRIHGGTNPLDATSIHPECYAIANDILGKVSATVDEVFPRWLMQPAREEIAAASLAEPKKDATPTDSKPAADPATPSTEEHPTEASDETTTEPKTENDATDATPANEVTPGSESVSPAAPDASVASIEPAVAPSDSSPESDAQSSNDESSAESDRSGTRREFEFKRKEIVKRISELDIDELAKSHGSGKLLVKDVIMSLKRPSWDPRDKVQKPLFRRGILKVDDLKPEMQLDGQVVNVVDFGVFVDIGLGESSLIHVSQLSNHYISDPYKHFSVGNIVKVWVTEVDAARRRVKLTAVRPGSPKPQRGNRNKNSRSQGSGKDGARDRDNTPSQPSQGAGSTSSNQRDQSRAPRRAPGKYEGRGNKMRSSSPRRDNRPAPPKVVKPITEKMLRGDEPMRSFSDLAQFVKNKPQAESKDKSNDSKSKNNEKKDN